MYTNIKLEVIENNAPYTDGEGNKYPRNFPKSEIAELHQVTESVRPVDANLVVEGFIIDETYTQVWQTRVKTQEEVDQEQLNIRQEALAVEWPDAFALLDDILANGIDDVNTRRTAVKDACPKPIGV